MDRGGPRFTFQTFFLRGLLLTFQIWDLVFLISLCHMGIWIDLDELDCLSYLQFFDFLSQGFMLYKFERKDDM